MGRERIGRPVPGLHIHPVSARDEPGKMGEETAGARLELGCNGVGLGFKGKQVFADGLWECAQQGDCEFPSEARYQPVGLACGQCARQRQGNPDSDPVGFVPGAVCIGDGQHCVLHRNLVRKQSRVDVRL